MNEIECRYFWEELENSNPNIITIELDNGCKFSFIPMPNGMFDTK